MLSAKTLETGMYFNSFPSTAGEGRGESSFETCELFICGDVQYITLLIRFVKKVLKRTTLIALLDLQLDEQTSYLFIYNTFIKILYMFRALPCSTSGGLRHNCIYAASGIVTL